MFDYRLALLTGTDIPFPLCQITIHQPTIKEISLIGEKNFFIGAQSLCLSKNILSVKDETVLENTSNFQIFMMIMSDSQTKDKKQYVLDVLSIILPEYKIMITPRSIVIQKDDISTLIDESNFEQFQVILREIFCLGSDMNQDTFNPGDEKAKEIAEKLMRGRQRIAEEKGKETGSTLAKYTSILAVGLNSMSLKDTIDLTLYQLYDLVQRYMLFVNWDLDVRTRLAGGKPDSQPDDWMKNIH